MKIKNIHHFVITTQHLQTCLDFYVGVLGMEHQESKDHYNLYFPGGKSPSIPVKVSFSQLP